MLHGAFRRRFSFGFLCGLLLLGEFLPLGGDAFEQPGGGFILRVLWDKLAGEGVAENRLAQRLRAF